jgi:glycine oxidase
LGDNASGVAAGMIAPVGEILFDDLRVDHLDLFRAGRDGWRTLERLAPGLAIDRSGATFLFDNENERTGALARLEVVGAEVAPLPAEALAALPTSGPDSRWGFHTPEDWRIDVRGALSALQAAITAGGGLVLSQALSPAQLDQFDAVVLAAGLQSRTFAALAPELSVLSPIKGQLVRFQGAHSGGSTLRTAQLYIAPQPGGVLAGSSMQAGRDDRTVDPQVIAEFRRQAVALSPNLDGYSFEGLAGVRAATPDGLPLAGPSSRPGLYLATGARRNGWLLAPLVSQILVSYLSGGDGGPFAAALDPRRFTHA